MTYLTDLHIYLHQSSLLLQAYPDARITTKYSLPRRSTKAAASAPPASDATSTKESQKREPSATLTLKTFHPPSGICLKYKTDKAQEVGRLMHGLGRIAKGEIVEMPASGANIAGAGAEGDKMDLDIPAASTAETAKTAEDAKVGQTQAQGGGKKKKKGGKK